MRKILSCLALTVLLFACKKSEIAVQPVQETVGTSIESKELNKNLTVTTTSVFVNSAIQVIARGNISNNGGGNSIVDRGFCYSTTSGPTLANDTTQAGSGAGDFQGLLAGLTPGTTYYVRAYGIKNNGDTYYGNELSFTTLTLGLPGPGVGTVTDIDGNIYNTITLGTQVWMVENLRTTHYRDATPIPNIIDNTNWTATTTGAYCDYDNDPANSTAYGRLYNKYAILDTRNITPSGWHIASTSEWFTLLRYAGGVGVAGGRMKETGFDHWLFPNTAADNTTGFTATGAGFRNQDGTFSGLQNQTRMWGNTYPTLYTFLTLYNTSGDYGFSSYGCPTCSNYGYSIRCVMD